MRRSTSLKTLTGAVVLAAALALSWATASPSPESPGAPAEPAPRRVETTTVAPATASSTLRFAATVRPVRRAAVAFTVPGRLVARPVEVGDRVAAGAALGRLESDSLDNELRAREAARAEAAARADQAGRERERVERLFAVKAATDEELEQARTAAEAAAAAVRRAEADLREARRRFAETTLTAPWAATVTEVRAEPGEYLAAGLPVVELAGDGALEVEVRLPEALVGTLAAGDPVAVARPFEGAADGAPRLEGRVRSVGRAAVGGGRLFPVVVDLPAAAGLYPGSTVEVLVVRAPDGGLAVPLGAVLNPGGGRPAVFVVRDGRAHRVAVRVAELAGEDVVLDATAGLAAGDPVVVAGHLGLIDGDPVEPVPAAAAGGEVSR